MPTTVRAEFVVLGSFDPDSVATRLGIRPTSTWRKGDSRQGTLLLYESNGASLSTGDIRTLKVEELVRRLLAELEPSKNKLIQLCAETDARAGIDCCVYVEDGELPELHFEAETLLQLSSLGLSLDVDIMILGND